MKPLIILGKGYVKGKDCLDARKDFPGFDVWTVGTHRIENADRYYEFHGIGVACRKMTRTVSEKTRKASSFLPLNNSICIMLVEAFYEGYTDIQILGAHMLIKKEYIQQRPAVAECIGWVKGMSQGKVSVSWDGEPEKVRYFDEYQ